MNQKILGITIFIILLVGCLSLIVFKVILPNRDEQVVEKVNLSISAVFEDKKVQTGLEINGEKINITRSYEIVSVPKNQETIIKNINLNNQFFYEREVRLNVTENTRYDLKLEEPSEIKITFDKSQPINVQIDADLENPFVCLTWSLAYIFVKLDNEIESEKPERYSKWDRCYRFSEINNKELKINFQEFSSPQKTDFINISVGIEDFPELDKIQKIK